MNKTSFTLLWILKKIKRRIPAIVLLTLFSVALSLFGVYFALGSRNIVDSAVAGNRQDFLHAIGKQACIIFGILFSNAMVHHLKERIQARLDQDWKKAILHNLLQSEYSSVSKFHSSELLNRMNSDVQVINGAVINLVPNLASMFTKLISVICVLSAITLNFTLILLAGGLVLIAVTALLRGRLKGLNKRVSEANGRVSGIIQETMEKLLAVQAMGISTEIERRTEARLVECFELRRKRKNISLISKTCTSILMYAASFATLVWCSSRLIVNAMTFGELTAITQLVGQIQRPFMGLSGIFPQYIAALAAAERLQDIDLLPKTASPREEPAIDIYKRFDEIRAENLVFSYDRDKILDSASFILKKGSFCVINGPSGTGKSTLLKLLLGIYQPEQGRLFLQCGNEEIPVDSSTRRLFSYVPQGNLIFSGTLRENLLVVRPDATDEEIAFAVYVSAMDEYIPSLPDGLDTILGESGAGLSEGQVQRLAIGRAVLGGAPILLLDECTSALDKNTEALVLQRLRSLSDKTCIAITHRPVLEGICDTAIQMEAGKITVKKLQ